MKQAIFLASCIAIAVLPWCFILNKAYKQRVIGHAALAGMSFAACMYLVEFVLGTRYHVLPQTVAMFSAVAVFLGWHYWRFYWRIVEAQREGVSANDIQNTVEFSTFADICEHRGSKDITVRLCRHKGHEAANTGIAVCAEPVCPIMGGKNDRP